MKLLGYVTSAETKTHKIYSSMKNNGILDHRNQTQFQKSFFDSFVSQIVAQICLLLVKDGTAINNKWSYINSKRITELLRIY